jgi:ABC-2 type transport system permease protein
MKQFITFIRKEFVHVFRDRKTLLMLFGLPVVQIILFGFALTNEIKNSHVAILNNAHDAASAKLIDRIEASKYFEVERIINNESEIDDVFKTGRIRAVIVFPHGFETELMHENKAAVQFIADASDPNTATTLANYLSSIALDFQREITVAGSEPLRIVPEIRMLYNPELKGAPNFVPGVISLVLMLICVMMTSISIVREKELGTMEILLVSPFKPIYVILAKAVPYLLLSFINLIVILLISVFALDLPIQGSILLLLAVSTLYIITALSLGLLISTTTASQQTAMLLSLMGMLLPTVLFSGFMFPIENMPLPLRLISNLVPAKWFYIIVKSVMIKGLGLAYIWKEVLVLAGMTVFLLGLSFRKFKIRLA